MIRRLSRQVASWTVFGLSVLTVPAAADFRSDYRLGVEALERGEWAQSAALLRQAANERPEEKARLSRKPFSRRYLPHFYLGQALLGSGDCEGALAAWAESERQGVIVRLPEFQSLTQGREVCRQQMASLLEAQRQAESEIGRADAAAQRVDRLQAELGSQWSTAASGLSSRQTEAWEKLRSARRELATSAAADEIDGMRQTALMAHEARKLMEEVEQDAIHLQGELRLQRGALVAEVGSLREESAELLQTITSLRPYPRRLGRLAQQVAELIEESQEAELGEGADRLRELRDELESALGRLREVAAPPPPALTAAARAFFDGDYEQVLESLDDLDTASRRVAIEAHILRAAAYFTLHQLAEEDGLELLESARAEVVSCLEIDRGRRPPAGPFSPRFLEFFNSQAASDSDGAAIAERLVLDPLE